MKTLLRQIYISYLRDKVDSYPDIRYGSRVYKGRRYECIWKVTKGKRTGIHHIHTPKGQELLKTMRECDQYKCILLKAESEWIIKYGEPCKSVNFYRYGNTPNRRLFDSLVTGKGPFKENNKIEYNGTLYKSNLEVQFATIMDEHGILYKYEPEITVFDGRHRYPDFIIYLPWLDLLILVEIYGLSEKDNYIHTIRDRTYDYMMSGWMPGRTMLSLFHYDKERIIPNMIMEELETIVLRNYLLNQEAA